MEFLAKSGNVNLNEMTASLACVIVSAPALLKKHRFGDDTAGLFHERGKKSEFNRRQGKRHLCAPYLPHVHIHREVTDVDPAARRGSAPAQAKLNVNCQSVEVIVAGETKVRSSLKNVADFDRVGCDAQDCDKHSPVLIA